MEKIKRKNRGSDLAMTTEQREAIERLNIHSEYAGLLNGAVVVNKADLDTVLSLIKKQQEQLELIKEYAYQEIVHYTEDIRDYIDDDKEGNKHIIGELKEEREHWKDIEKILQNKSKEELYMNWWRYGLYE